MQVSINVPALYAVWLVSLAYRRRSAKKTCERSQMEILRYTTQSAGIMNNLNVEQQWVKCKAFRETQASICSQLCRKSSRRVSYRCQISSEAWLSAYQNRLYYASNVSDETCESLGCLVGKKRVGLQEKSISYLKNKEQPPRFSKTPLCRPSPKPREEGPSCDMPSSLASVPRSHLFHSLG